MFILKLLSSIVYILPVGEYIQLIYILCMCIFFDKIANVIIMQQYCVDHYFLNITSRIYVVSLWCAIPLFSLQLRILLMSENNMNFLGGISAIFLSLLPWPMHSQFSLHRMQHKSARTAIDETFEFCIYFCVFFHVHWGSVKQSTSLTMLLTEIEFSENRKPVSLPLNVCSWAKSKPLPS